VVVATQPALFFKINYLKYMENSNINPRQLELPFVEFENPLTIEETIREMWRAKQRNDLIRQEIFDKAEAFEKSMPKKVETMRAKPVKNK
jgi:hypothetical protein